MIRRMSPLARLTNRQSRIGLVADNEADTPNLATEDKETPNPYARLADPAPEPKADAEDKPAAMEPLTLHSPIMPERVQRTPRPDTAAFEQPSEPEMTPTTDAFMASPETETPSLAELDNAPLSDDLTDVMDDMMAEDEPETFDLVEEDQIEPVQEYEAPTAPAMVAPAEPKAVEPAPAPAPTDAAPARRSSRVKTTFLGFDRSDGRIEGLFDEPNSEKATTNAMFPVGWLVIVEGEGRGNSIAIHDGVSQIGRGDDQAIQLDFGDNSISRSNHAAIAFDDETRAFYLGYGGKSNIVRLNGKPVLATETLEDGDLIRIGETTLRFIAFCGAEFSWNDQ